jgi:cyclophilin family peptidyl-prolyl cis-trans isomerase
VVFGKVIDGMLTLRKIENVATGMNSRPKLVVKITGQSPSLIPEGRHTEGNWQNVGKCRIVD